MSLHGSLGMESAFDDSAVAYGPCKFLGGGLVLRMRVHRLLAQYKVSQSKPVLLRFGPQVRLRSAARGWKKLKHSRLVGTAHVLLKYCKALGLCVPLVAAACPQFAPPDSGETLAFPHTPIKDPALWMQHAADQECPGNERRKYAAEADRQFGKVRLIYNPCRSGTNTTYAVFENYAGRVGDSQFCAIGEVGGSMVDQLPNSPEGYVRIKSYSHISAFEGIVTRYELRPDGVRKIGKPYKKLAE